MRDEYYQFDEHSCGLAALRMALCHAASPAWRFVTLYEHPPYSLKQLEQAARAYGFSLEFYQSPAQIFDYPAGKRKPFLVLMDESGADHLCLVKRIGKRRVIFLDPHRGRRTMDKDDFKKSWKGIWASCVQTRKDPPPKARTFFPLGSRILSYLLLFIEELLIGFGFYFLNAAPSFVPPILILLSFVIEVERRFLLLRFMRRFDRRWQGRIYDPNPDRLRKNYECFNLFKKNIFASFSSVIVSLSSAILLTVLLGINAPAFFLSAGAVAIMDLVIALIVSFPRRKKLADLSERERKLYGDGTEKEKREEIESLSRESDRYGKILLIEQAVRLAGVILFAFLPLIFIEEPSANYYLFHLFGLYVVAEGFRQTSEYVVDRPNQARNKGYFREYMAKDFPDEEQPLL